MSTENSQSLVNDLSVSELEKILSSQIENLSFTVEKIHNITIAEKQIDNITSTGLTVTGTYKTGDSGFPDRDTFDFAEDLNNMLSHPTCQTENTEGYPVWFENAAWCMSCNSLIDATDTIVYAITCPYCGDTFEDGDVMRATYPEELLFAQYIPFEKPCKTVEAVKEKLESVD
jgi:hypothetical protein